jgi:starvation-inducible DNA-binding protein
MSRKNNAMPEEQQAKLIELLNRRLADAIDLQLRSRQAYWNVKGPQFMSLRELFDKIAQGVEKDANLIAERIVQLGGKAEGTAHAVADRTSLDGYRLATADGNGFTEIARDIDKWLWYVETSQQPDS